jgi:hypothetical protein
VARAELSRQQHRDRRDAQDPRDEHLQGGPGQDAQALQGHRVGPEPAVQEGVRGGVRPVRRRALRLPRGRLPLRPRRPGRRAAGRDVQGGGGSARAVHHRRVAHADADGLLAGAGQSARPDQDLLDARVRRVALAARVRRRQVHRPGDAALPVAAAVRRAHQPGGGLQLRGGHGRGRPQQVHVGQRRLCDGGQHQPLVQAVRLVLAHSRHRVRRRGGEPAGAQLPHRRRRRRHEVPDRDRHCRPARGRAGQGRPDAADPPQEQRLRGLHRRAVAAQAGRVRRPGRHRQRQPRRAAAVPVRHLPLRALPQVHRARQGGFVQGARRHAALAAGLDRAVRGWRPGALVGVDQGQQAARGGRGGGGGDRGQPRLLLVEVLFAAALSARRADRVAATGVQAAIGQGRRISAALINEPSKERPSWRWTCS